MRRSLLPWDHFFCLMQSVQVLPLIFPRLFYFIRFTDYSYFLFPLKDNVSLSMGVTTGFPAMVPLSTFLNYFTISATNFSPIF